MNEHIIEPLKQHIIAIQAYLLRLNDLFGSDRGIYDHLLKADIRLYKAKIRELQEDIERETQIDYKGLREGDKVAWLDFDAYNRWASPMNISITRERLGEITTIVGLWRGYAQVEFKNGEQQSVHMSRFFDFFIKTG